MKGYTRQQVQDATLAALDAAGLASSCHIETIADDVLRRLDADPDAATVLHGWRIERAQGADIPGTKSRYKKFQGWKLTDVQDGEVRWLPPQDARGDVAMYWAEQFSKSFREMKSCPRCGQAKRYKPLSDGSPAYECQCTDALNRAFAAN